MSAETKAPTCALCGEPMPPGEEMFQYHGYSGPCPKPPAAASTAPSTSPPAPAPGDEPAEPLGWIVVAEWMDGRSNRIDVFSRRVWRHRSDAEMEAAEAREDYGMGSEFRVEPVGRAEREPRTSEQDTSGGRREAQTLARGNEPEGPESARLPDVASPFALPVRVDVAFFTPIGKEKIAVVRLLDAGGQEVAKFVESPDDVENGHDWLIRCAWFIADCINARRAAPPSSTEDESA